MKWLVLHSNSKPNFYYADHETQSAQPINRTLVVLENTPTLVI